MPDQPPSSALEENPASPGEIEFVLGQRQVASILFVAIVAVAVLCTFAYIAGRAISARGVRQPPVVRVIVPPIPPPVLAKPAESSKPAETPQASRPAYPSFGSTTAPAPRPGEVYLQIGAVERGFAEVLVVGLRAKGFPSVMTPSSSEKIFRVLIGPLNDPAAYARAKTEVEAAGLNFFPRRYQVGSDAAPVK